MTTRAAKVLLIAAIALYYSLVVFNNLTDSNSNYQFVRHVLSMDNTFPGNHGMGRALPWPAIHVAFYASILVWELSTTVLLWWGAVRLWRALRRDAAAFNAAKNVAIVAMTLSMLMWMVAFISVGGEWFLMWQSPIWNGIPAASRDFAIVGIVLLLVVQPDTEGQP